MVKSRNSGSGSTRRKNTSRVRGNFKRARINTRVLILCTVTVLIVLVVLLFSPWGILKDNHSAKEKKNKKVVAKKTTDGAQGESSSQVKSNHTSINEPGRKTQDTTPPCVAIVVDDTGNTDMHLWEWIKVDAPLTFAVMPYTSFGGLLSNFLYDAGNLIIMHVPTQNEPPRSFAGKGQLSVGMSRETVYATLDGDAAGIAHISGINNHEGGLGCNDLLLMTSECEWAKQRGLYVVDSNSSARSTVTQATLSTGMKRKLNNVFIDHQNDPGYIRSAMNKLASLAREKGYAIGICHFYRPNTATVVGEMVDKLRAEGIHFAFVRDITN